ncbi:MAG: hypothetical protein IAG10_35430 [Planctomycetaceae bacterium]|nr:hypothetical protein [Planctomycetaceae bacterium]
MRTICRIPISRIALLAWAFSAVAILPAAETGTSWALILAPSRYSELAAAPYHVEGATQLTDRLQKAGFAADHVVLLTIPSGRQSRPATAESFRKQLAAMVDRVGVNDVFLVAVSSYAVRLGDADYVCASDTSKAELARIGDAGQPRDRKTLISVQEIVEQMSLSASTKRCLLIDAAGSRAQVAKDAASRPGERPLQVPDHQWVMFNDGDRLTQPADGNAETSCFMQSVIDGLAVHADSNSDRQVTLFELSDYCQLSAEAQQLSVPIFHGKATANFPLAATSEDPNDARRLPAELRQRLSEELLSAARNALLVENRGAAALEALNRAAQYRPNPKVQGEIDRLTATAIALKADAPSLTAAWERANAQQRPLIVLLRFATDVQVPGEITVREVLPAGTLVKVTKFVNGEWLKVEGQFRPQFDLNRLNYTAAPLAEGFVRLSSLRGPAKASDNVLAPTLDKAYAGTQSRFPQSLSQTTGED